MGIDFKMIKIHEIVSDSGEICKMSSGNFQRLHSYCNYFIVKNTGSKLSYPLILILSVFCMLIDPNGYVVYTKQFMSHPR